MLELPRSARELTLVALKFTLAGELAGSLEIVAIATREALVFSFKSSLFKLKRLAELRLKPAFLTARLDKLSNPTLSYGAAVAASKHLGALFSVGRIRTILEALYW